MPAIEPTASQGTLPEGELPFPPVTRDHILHCAYDYWFPKYRASCIRSRIIPLTPDFISWLHEDGIILADEGSSKDDTDTADSDDDDDWEPSFPASAHPRRRREDGEPDTESDSDSDEPASAPRLPPDIRFPILHAEITSAISSLGGAVAPKLNWSSPKDATWISRHPNTMKCTSANDIYILLKSSSFISHDLDHAFDDTVPAPTSGDYNPVLVLRSFFNPLPSLEFRCFVKSRSLIAITQRDLNYYAFLDSLRPQIIHRTIELFNKMRFTFPDGNFVFDVYIPEADYDDEGDDNDDNGGEERKVLGRARLIDINPWAPRTDTLLFDWGELLAKTVARPLLGFASDMQEGQGGEGEEGLTTDDDEEEDEEEPELRLVEHDDPAAYNFSSPQYSAHKLPKDVVDASLAGEGGIREFAQHWQRITERRERR
ncbi:D123-domain-containing protein [Parathielavia appendiculata]|uniref:D123-domain-containing protein n=1 Tax=Parathielavia appendiculata TaxID=2587402 RepID=A0AAN6TYV1_9PEZI|nr:D123-domain-containing protein [Parathielavia appendiculata]